MISCPISKICSKKLLRYPLIIVFFLCICQCICSCAQCNEPEKPKSAAASSSKVKSDDVFVGLMPGYVFETPEKMAVLPGELQEASGVAEVSMAQVAMVQDEDGIIFLYNLKENKIIHRIPFGPPGDYEGITRIGDTMFVLESRGKLFEVKNWQENPTISSKKLHLPTADNEGLCYDPLEKALLISPKSRWKKNKKGKRQRPIFLVDIETGQMRPNPLLVLKRKDIVKFAKKHKLSIPHKKTKKGKKRILLRFLPSAIAVHPVTHDIYILSAVDHTLASFNRDGEVTGFQMLNKTFFPQPEGMTFLPDSSLVIVNEAAKAKPNIISLKWKR